MYDTQRTATFMVCLTTKFHTASYYILHLLISNRNVKDISGTAIILLFYIPHIYFFIDVEYCFQDVLFYYYFLWLCSPARALASSYHEVS
jgi:hypothetical protein